MQANIFLFAFLLLVSAVLVHGKEPACDETPLYYYRGDAAGWKWTFQDGKCTEVAVSGHTPTTNNRFDSQQECQTKCLS
uniref:Savignygrin-like 1 n=1 Tax=Ornithodoros parkeri TaxID=140564 RepID=A6NA02_ORNPR|nr:savignygrin-like 1 [Ornithodoros parkeri]